MDSEGRSPYAWVLWRYRWLWLALLVLFPLISLVVQDRSQERVYTATALIVTKELSVNVTTLPRYASVVFQAGQVAETVAQRGGLGIPPDQLIPTKINLEPVEDSFLFRMVGRDKDPEVAARLANDAAAALVVELNKPGEGVGSFALQEQARVPTTTPDSAVVVPLLAGAAAGALAVAGSVAMAVSLGRPVLSGEGAVRASGATMSGVLVLPRRRSPQELTLAACGGLVSVARRLVQEDSPRVLMLHGHSLHTRVTVSRLLAEYYLHQGPVTLCLPAEYHGFATAGDLGTGSQPIDVQSSMDVLGERSGVGLVVGDVPPEQLRRSVLEAHRVLLVREGDWRSRLVRTAEGLPAGPDAVLIIKDGRVGEVRSNAGRRGTRIALRSTTDAPPTLSEAASARRAS